MSEFVIVFLQLTGVMAGLALMGVVIWTAQKDEFQTAQSFAPKRARRLVDRRAPSASRRPRERLARGLHST